MPCPADLIDPELLVIDMPEMVPAETLPELLPIVVWLIIPEPGCESSTALMEPELVPTVRLLIVP
jgi:hypothetical protein